MKKVKNVSGQDRIVDGRLVLRGAVYEVPAERVESFVCQVGNWELVAPTTKKKES